MSKVLLDVNVLLALLWPAHESHAAVQRWFRRTASRGWATCPFTQAGFVRILSNPAFSRDAVTPEEACRVLSANLEDRNHDFWPDALSYSDAVGLLPNRPAGHRQVTDAYLLALAIGNRGRLATLDRSIQSMLPEEASQRKFVELIAS